MRRVIESFRYEVTQERPSPATSVLSEGATPDAAAPGSRSLLLAAGCRVGVYDLDVSFDLVWVRADGQCEFFPNLF
jgi:hypothetical protein